MKKETLAKIADWNDKVAMYQQKKADLHKELLFLDIKLNGLMLEYDKLCKKLLTSNKEK